MFAYKKYTEKATDKLTKYGQDIEIIDVDLSTVLHTAKAISSPVDLTKLPESLVDRVTMHFTCSSVPITNDQYIRWNGEIYKVYNVSPVNLTNEEILVQFYAGV